MQKYLEKIYKQASGESSYPGAGIDDDIKRQLWQNLLGDAYYLGASALPRLEERKPWGNWRLENGEEPGFLPRKFAQIIDALRKMYFPIIPPEEYREMAPEDIPNSYWRLYALSKPYMKTAPPSQEELEEWAEKRKQFISK